MKRHLSKMLCAVLSLCLILTGCGGGGETSGGGTKPMGRYVEQQLQELENLGKVFAFQVLEDGSFSFYAAQMDESGNFAGMIHNKVSADGKNIESTEVEWISNLVKEGGAPNSVDMDAQGNLYILYNNADGAHISKSSDGKTFTEIPVPDWQSGETSENGDENAVSAEKSGSASTGSFSFGGEGQTLQPQTLKVLDNGDFLVSYFDAAVGVRRYSGTDGSRLMEYAGGLFELAAYGNKLVVTDTEMTKILEYDIDTGKLLQEYTYDALSWDTYVGIDKDGIFVVDSNGLSRIAEGGSVWERVIDGSLTSLNIPTLMLMGFNSDGNGVYYGIFLSQEDTVKVQIMKYSYSADTPTNPDTELTLFGLQDNPTIRQAIGIFQQQNPNVRINYRVAMDDESSVTVQDVIKALNTELLAGKAPDLLLLDGLPVNSYIEKGVLLDISDLIGELTQSENLLPNVMKTFEKDGKTYAAPTRYTIPVMIGDNTVMDNYQSLTDLAGKVEKSKDGEPVDFRIPDSIASRGLLSEYYPYFVNSWLNGKEIDEQKLASFLRDIQNMYQKLKPADGEDSMMGGVIISSSSGGGGEMITMGPVEISEGKAKASIEQINGMEGCRYILQYFKDMDNMGIRSLFGRNEYTPVGNVGIVASGKQQEMAKAFLKTLLSQSVQNWNMGDGLPVNQNAFERNYRKMTENDYEGGQVLDDRGLREAINGLNKPILIDEVIKGFVMESQEDLLNGVITPEDAAQKIVESTELYRSE